jgi:hypothetical protein
MNPLTLQWIYVVKNDDSIVFKTESGSDYLEKTICIVKDAEQKSCDHCQQCHLRDIKMGEEWVAFCNTYFCPTCFIKLKPKFVEFVQQQKNLQKKLPHKLADVAHEIEQHYRFDKLDLFTKMQYEECKLKATKDNNKYMKSLWLHLYHEKELPQ